MSHMCIDVMYIQVTIYSIRIYVRYILKCTKNAHFHISLIYFFPDKHIYNKYISIKIYNFLIYNIDVASEHDTIDV